MGFLGIALTISGIAVIGHGLQWDWWAIIPGCGLIFAGFVLNFGRARAGVYESGIYHGLGKAAPPHSIHGRWVMVVASYKKHLRKDAYYLLVNIAPAYHIEYRLLIVNLDFMPDPGDMITFENNQVMVRSVDAEKGG